MRVTIENYEGHLGSWMMNVSGKVPSLRKTGFGSSLRNRMRVHLIFLLTDVICVFAGNSSHLDNVVNRLIS